MTWRHRYDICHDNLNDNLVFPYYNIFSVGWWIKKTLTKFLLNLVKRIS